MTQPISFTVRPPTSAPHRPSPLGNGGSRGAPSRRLFELNGHDEDEDEDEDHQSSSRSRSNRPKEERIDGYRNGKALGGEKPAGPLVIPSLPNRDWRASSSRTPSYRPETRDLNEVIETHERTGDGPQRSGLRKKNDPTNYNDPYDKIKQEPSDSTISITEAVKQEYVEEDIKPIISQESEDVKKQTLEEQALQAILSGDVKVESDEERLRRELIIVGSNALSEEEALKRDIDELPEVSTAEDYAAIPVSAFGEAMARGMGWNPKSNDGTKIHEPKLRPALLGLGATALEKPLPPSRNGSSSGSNKKPKINKKDSMRINLGESIIKRESSEIPSSSGTNTRESSRRASPESDFSSSSKRRRDQDEHRDRDGKRYETEEERARRKARARERGREYETEEERARRKAKEKERNFETDEERAKRKAKEREGREKYDGDRERERSDKYDRDRRDDRDRDRRDRHDRDGDRRRDR
ncbi:uncharacterized protein I206_106576 [Kwoniella pini CBS 10737]|uniref:Spp2/MOS2 G-patch domain-containing protein n=1 Tax=Kwoniella pini CBS 10737 TaxID=1296096 RepID=A0A1B9HTT0_9TREE|nr:uncharacterized protein I206_07533 [Kwoniella pini CBS 10737]OCF46678.1 hypothetical protein I206_07533 [Kwoniella pini CBS 10737]